MSAVLSDLQTKGLPDQTGVVLGTEFGRTPQISNNGWRDHDDEAVACLLAGGWDQVRAATTSRVDLPAK